MNERHVVIGIVNGAHYDLSYDEPHWEKSYEEANELMMIWKDTFNCNEPFFIGAKLGKTTDVIRTDTIEKMYIKTFDIKKDK